MALPKEEIRVVRRLLSEATSALLNLKLLQEWVLPKWWITAEGVPRSAVIRLALEEDLLARLTRLLDLSSHSQVRSFMYLMNNYRADFENFAATEKIELSAIDDVAKRWKPIRDQTIMHIDLASTVDPRSLWKRQDVKGNEVRMCLNGIWKICDFLYPDDSQVVVAPPRFPENDSPIVIPNPPDSDSTDIF